MKDRLLDTNVIVRYLIEAPATIDPKFRGVFSFFVRLEKGEATARLVDLVLFQAYFVLTSFYEVPVAEAAAKLEKILLFKGIQMAEKPIAVACLRRLQTEKLDIVDAYMLAWADERGLTGVYSFDTDLRKKGLTLLEVN